MRIEIGNFYYAKVFVYHNEHIDKAKSYKIRPVLVINKRNNNYYNCLTCTTLLRDAKDITRLDLFLDKHSQIICDKDALVKENNFYSYIKKCDNEDFNYILQRYKELKELKNKDFYFYINKYRKDLIPLIQKIKKYI